MNFSLEAPIYKIFDVQVVNEKFQKREFVLEVQDGSYAQMIKFQLVQDKCDWIDSYKVGDTVKVHFNLRGREWQDKFFTNLDAWKLEKVGASTAAATTAAPPAAESMDFPKAENAPAIEADDDLPF